MTITTFRRCWKVRYSLQQRWRPLPPCKATLAAPRAARACPCGGRDGRLPSRPPSQPAQTPTSAAPASSSPLIDRQFEVSALSGGSVGRLCGSGGRVWSGDRSPSLVCVFSGRLCELGSGFRWFPKEDFCVSRNFFTSGGQSAAVFVRVCQHGSFVKSIPCSLVPFSRSISIWLA